MGKNLEPFRSWRISSNVGYGWCVRQTASLGFAHVNIAR